MTDVGMGPYGLTVWEYRRAGWAGVLPLPPGRKGPPPAGFTGWAGVDPSGADVQAWLDEGRGAGNIGLHLPTGVYGLDVDAYGEKDGAGALKRLVDEHGPLPATWVVTSRDDGVSGIRLYRAELAPGRVWVDEPAGHGVGIEAIHKGHRYAVAWPSVHPDTGRTYRWWWTDGRELDEGALPRAGELPELPPAWVEALSRPGEVRTGEAAGHEETVSVVTGWREGDACPRVAAAAQRAMGGLREAKDGAALHPAATAGIHELVNLGHEGHAGVRRALAEHHSAHVEIRAARGDDSGAAEWWRLVRGAVGKLTASTRRAHCDCDLLRGVGVTFTPDELGVVWAGPAGVTGDAFMAPASVEGAAVEAPASRIVDLGPWLDGSYAPPKPTHGHQREDTQFLLYPGRWHNVDAPSEAGKSMLAIAHAYDEMLNAGRTVVYVHFEEELPGGTVERLLAVGLDRELIRARFVWLSNEVAWEAGHLAAELAGIPNVGLVVLDGRNAACSRHGRDPALVDTVGWFRHRFVSPASRLGAAVLSLGHPPKARDRQDERHGYGSTAWLDEIDGVAFRLVPAKGRPIRKGEAGATAIHVVKDRYGEVSRLCRPEERDGWRYAGSLSVDDTGVNMRTALRLTAPGKESVEDTPDPLDALGDQIVEALRGMEGQQYGTQRGLADRLRALKIKFRDDDLASALERLELLGKLEREPDQGPRKPRPGWLSPEYRDSSTKGHLNAA